MSTIAQINVQVTADTAQFTSSMQHAGESAEHFNAHMFTSRHAIQTFSALADTPAAPVMHLIHAFEVFPGPAGLVIGALFALKEVMNQHAEAAKKAKEEHENFQRILEHTRSSIGPTEGSFARGPAEDVKTLQAQMDKMSSTSKDFAEFRKTRDDIADVAEAMRELDDAIDADKDALHDLKMAGGDTRAMLRVLDDEADRLGQAMSQVPEKSREWRQMKTELQGVQTEMKHLNDELDKADQKFFEETRKAQQALNDKIEKQFESMQEAGNKAAEAFRKIAETPLEKFTNEIQQIKDLVAGGFLSDQDALKAADTLAGRFKQSSSLPVGSFREIDQSHLSVRGLSMQGQKQEVHDPQLETVNQKLEELKQVLAQPTEAIAG